MGKIDCHKSPRSEKSPAHPPDSLRNRTILLLAAILVVGIWIPPSFASDCDTCITCHGTLGSCPGDFDHTATPGSGWIVIHHDTGHDDAGWYGEKPYFDVFVDCSTCHASELRVIHGNDCTTCHPAPNDTLGTWQGGCQQGGCHAAYHEDSINAHVPWEDPYDPANNCDNCHEPVYGDVEQARCLNCHAGYTGDSTPPVTSTNAIGSYIGSARIVFSITDNGKVGIGRTFYKLDGGPEKGGMEVFVTNPGMHVLEFWSKDQSGNIETPPKSTSFDITADVTPPATTSDAQTTPYYQGGKINLTATDEGTLGVKETYFSINGGPTQTGTVVTLPAAPGLHNYEVAFWSVDWSNNVEPQNTVSVSVNSGLGTLRLIWGESDINGSPCNGDPEANADWTIRRGGWNGTVVASGGGACPNWSGVNEIQVEVSPTAYFVRVDWWDSWGEYYDQTDFPNLEVSAHGQVIPLRY